MSYDPVDRDPERRTSLSQRNLRSFVAIAPQDDAGDCSPVSVARRRYIARIDVRGPDPLEIHTSRAVRLAHLVGVRGLERLLGLRDQSPHFGFAAHIAT